MASSGITKPMKLSADLEAVVGSGPMGRGEVTKKLWEYIRANGLQDQTNKTMINPDATLAKVLGSEQIHMMKIAGKLSPHILAPAA